MIMGYHLLSAFLMLVEVQTPSRTAMSRLRLRRQQWFHPGSVIGRELWKCVLSDPPFWSWKDISTRKAGIGCIRDCLESPSGACSTPMHIPVLALTVYHFCFMQLTQQMHITVTMLTLNMQSASNFRF